MSPAWLAPMLGPAGFGLAEASRLVDWLEATPPATPDDVNAAGGDRS